MPKIHARRILIIAAVIAVMLGVALALAISFVRPSPSAALPNPNGYDDLLKAGHSIIGSMNNVATLDHDGLHALVATNSEALRLLRVGLGRRCAIPTELLITNFGSASANLIALISLEQLLSAEGRLAQMENRNADAIQSYADLIRLGNDMSRGGLMINRLAGIVCEGSGCIPLARLLPKLNCEQTQSLARQLEQIADNTVPWNDILQNENRFAYAQMKDHPIKMLSELWQARNVRQTVQEKHDKAAAHVRLLAAELALRTYKCDQGSVPQTLSQLVPKYLQHIPTDPFTGKPLAYHPSVTNWVLYSFGPDRKDDGGKPIRKMSADDFIDIGSSKSEKDWDRGDILYASPW